MILKNIGTFLVSLFLSSSTNAPVPTPLDQNAIDHSSSHAPSMSDNDLDACYASLPGNIEVPTSREWWRSNMTTYHPSFATLTSFFRDRLPFEPLLDSQTVIAGVLFSFSGTTFKLSAHFPPLHTTEARTAFLHVYDSDGTNVVATDSCHIMSQIWLCQFRITQLPNDKDYRYVVSYKPRDETRYEYSGVIPKPVYNPNIAAMGCFGTDGTKDHNRTRLVKAVFNQRPDLLLLQGDQTYFHSHLGFGVLQLIWTIQELTRNIPTIVQMDDHDVGEPNLWGAGYSYENSGKGFMAKSACLINALQQQSMAHNPDSATNETLWNGITVHYGIYEYGRIDLAILEARKFKNFENGDSLLGGGQEKWLKTWCEGKNERTRIVLAQTPFAALATHGTGTGGGIGAQNNQAKDENGYPVPGRTRALEILKGCTSLVLSGDQHLGIAVSYDDYGVTECTSPAAVNSIWWRINRNQLNASHYDALGNQYSLHAVWNVDDQVLTKYKYAWDFTEGADDINRADGFLMVNIEGSQATCSAWAYQTKQISIWSHSTPIISK